MVKQLLVRVGLMSENDTWGDVLLGLVLVWTFVGIVGYAFGVRIGWWDLLGFDLPKNPRYAY